MSYHHGCHMLNNEPYHFDWGVLSERPDLYEYDMCVINLIILDVIHSKTDLIIMDTTFCIKHFVVLHVICYIFYLTIFANYDWHTHIIIMKHRIKTVCYFLFLKSCSEHTDVEYTILAGIDENRKTRKKQRRVIMMTSWHQMHSASLVLCEDNPSVSIGSPSKW